MFAELYQAFDRLAEAEERRYAADLAVHAAANLTFRYRNMVCPSPIAQAEARTAERAARAVREQAEKACRTARYAYEQMLSGWRR